MYKINVSDIQIFLAVAELKSFTKAANQFFLTQPAISKSIRHLEEELNITLFERSRRHVILTEYGEYLYKKWKPAYVQLSEAMEGIESLKDQKKHQLYIGVLYGFDFVSILTDAFTSFEQNYPDISINFSIYNPKELRDKMDQFDFVLSTNYDMESFPKYEQIVLNPVPMFAAISKKNPLSEKKRLTLGDIKEEPFIIFSDQSSPTAIGRLHELFQVPTMNLNFIAVDNIPTQFLKVRRNEGIALTNAYAFRGFEENITLNTVTDLYPDLCCVCAYKETNLTDPALNFLAFMKHLFPNP